MKVKFANKVFEVLYTKEVEGLTMYAVEDEPNHIDWLINVEVIDTEKKELKKIEPKPVWSEEDEGCYNSIIEHLKYSITNGKPETYRSGRLTDWLRSIKEKMKGE